MAWRITSRFMQQESFRLKGHSGIDFAMPNHTPLRSIQDGIVQKVVNYGDANIGRGVLVRWTDGKVAIYGHMSETRVVPGQIVKTGDLLGYSGNTGHVVGKNGYHLHFGLKENGHFIDPSPYIQDIQNMNKIMEHHDKWIHHIPSAPMQENFQQMWMDSLKLLEQLKVNVVHWILHVDWMGLVIQLKHLFHIHWF